MCVVFSVCVCVDSLRLLQVRVHVGFISAEAGWSLLLLLLCHYLQRHLHLPLKWRQQTHCLSHPFFREQSRHDWQVGKTDIAQRLNDVYFTLSLWELRDFKLHVNTK